MVVDAEEEEDAAAVLALPVVGLPWPPCPRGCLGAAAAAAGEEGRTSSRLGEKKNASPSSMLISKCGLSPSRGGWRRVGLGAPEEKEEGGRGWR